MKIAVVLVTAALLLAPGAVLATHLSEQEVLAREQACEAAREKKLKPERIAVIERCMREEGLDQAQCTQRYGDYGERKTGAIRTLGKYYDLPVCIDAYEARKHYKLNPGR